MSFKLKKKKSNLFNCLFNFYRWWARF